MKKQIPLGKKRTGESFVTYMVAKDLVQYLGWLSSNGHTKASALLVACALEAIERRIDVALGVNKTENEYELDTRKFYRELARVNFHPLFSGNIKRMVEHTGIAPNYAKAVNMFKDACGIPRCPVDGYTVEHMRAWSNGLVSFGTLAEKGYNFTDILTKVAAMRR